mgnify:CR=1 FL=1
MDARGRALLEAQLLRYERAGESDGDKAGAGDRAGAPQIAVVVLPSLEGEPIEDVAIRFAERWKIGSKADDGVLLVVGVGERKIRIETGYGVEGRLTDALSARIIREIISPRLHTGDYAVGLRAGCAAIHQALTGQPVTGVDPQAEVEPLRAQRRTAPVTASELRDAWFRDPRTLRIGAGRDFLGRRKDGTEVAFEIGLAPVRTERGLHALAALVDDGALIVIEPALRDTARALHELRDAVLTRGRGHVVLPCTRAESPCPALAAPEDWCHEDRPLRLPPRTAELARLTHLRDGGMKFSYLVLRRAPLASPPAAAPGGHAWRIVGAPRPAKGKLELLGCGAAGWVPLRRLRRHRADVNRALDEAVRGDVLHIAAPVEEGRVEIASETPVTRWAVAAADDA